MKDVFIVYGTGRGRTGRIAGILENVLTEANLRVESKNVFLARPSELKEYPYAVLGCSTYGQGDLQRDFLDFERGMDDIDLSGLKAAVFGSGNSRYACFAQAVDILEARVKILGGRLLLPGLRQDMMYGRPEGEDVRAWAGELAAAILSDGAG